MLVEEPDLSFSVNELVNAGFVQWSPWIDLNPTNRAEALMQLVASV